MVTLDMTDKGRSVAVNEDSFSTETGILTLQISLGTYDLTGKTITAIFSETAVETSALSVVSDVIQLPITTGLIASGKNEIQLYIREGLTLEQSPIMVLNVLAPVTGADPAPTDVDIITGLINQANLATVAAQAVVDSFEDDLGEGHILQADLQASIATGTPLLSDLQDANSTAGGLLTDLTTPSTGAIDLATAINTTLTDATIPNATSINSTLTVTTIPAATSINTTLTTVTTPAATSINNTLSTVTTPAATSINNTLTNTTIPLAQATETSLNLAIAAGSVDTLQEKVGTLQGEVKGIEDTILQMNPNGDAKITVSSFDTVNSLPKNAAQAGLGVVQEGMTATNLIDGDFSATGDWTPNVGTFTVANGVGSILAAAQYQNIQQIINIIATNKYYIKAMVKLTTGTTEVGLVLHDGTNINIVATANSTDWQKVSAIITPAASGVGYVGLMDLRTGAWDSIQIKEFRTVNLTSIAKQAATLSQADAMLLDYFSGTQSAVTGRVRSVCKNRFDGILETGTLDASGVNAVDATKIRSKNFIKVKPSTAYIFSNGSGYTALTASYYTKDKVFISQSAVNYATFTTPALTHFIRFQTTGTNTSANIQLELGTTATPFIAHAKTESYTKPMPLYRVPNGVADTVENGRYIKRVQRYTIQSADVSLSSVAPTNFDIFAVAITNFAGINTSGWANDYNGSVTIQGFRGAAYSDVLGNVGTFYLNNTPQIRFCLAKGTTLADARTAIAGKLAQYQLATPIITENVSSGTLLAYPSGTVYWEPVIADVAIYASGATILNTGYPISSLESIYKIDLVTGEQTPLAVASATVASGGLSFTHTGLSNGDMVGFTYYFSHPYPYGENDYTYINSNAVVLGADGVYYKIGFAVDIAGTISLTKTAVT